MKRTKEIFIHILPVLLGVVITMYLSAMVYHQMLEREEQDSLEQLQSVASSMAEKVNIRFTDNINLLERVADAISLKAGLDQKGSILEYLRSVRDTTIFQRLDIMFPDGRVMHQTGDFHEVEGILSFDAALQKGAHYSPRITDRDTDQEVIYCVVPIYADEVAEGLLIGVVDCMSLSDYIRTYSFDGETQVFMVDRRDGSFIMDNWHDTLGSIEQMSGRQQVKGHKNVDRADILGGEAGSSAFYSKTNGKASYMAYTPVEGFPWTLAVAAQEDTVLKNVRELSASLNKIALVEMGLLLSYLVWNLFVAYVLVKQRHSVQKMKLDAATNQAKSVFLSSVSHDIRTPLNGILGMLDVIDSRRDDPRQLEESLQKIRISAEYLVTLADNVLDLNDLESGKGQVQEDPIDLRKLGEELDVIVQAKLKGSSVSYELRYGALQHPYVLGSDGYLHRILTNLIGNAIKYNKENGNVWVTVEELHAQEGSSLYRFTVKDTGIGMSREFRERMFNAFVQEESGARTGNTGHGLGLAIVDRMVRRMGGSIRVESEKGVGSTFAVTLPFRWDPEGEARETQSRTQDAPVSLQGANILLAEDNELNMEIARILLGDTGACVTPAADGGEALAAFAASAEGFFDVILMDIMMPNMDGCEAARQIRALKRRDAPVVPIIAMTASTFTEDIQRCREAGMNEHVGKPLNMASLITMVSQHRETYRSIMKGEHNQ